jgi:hypothetical protein
VSSGYFPEVEPPGKARIAQCGNCHGEGLYKGRVCPECGGSGRMLWRACPYCGDIGFDRLADGTYACRISCGARWDEDHPGWLAQRLPGT